MDEYIKRQDAILVGYRHDSPGVVADLRMIPAVDVIERKKGEWIVYGRYYKCSECGELSPGMSKFCANCGVKMKEERQ